MVKRHNYSARKLADHLRVTGLAGAGGTYLVCLKVGGDEYILVSAFTAILIWLAALLAATLLDITFGEPDQ